MKKRVTLLFLLGALLACPPGFAASDEFIPDSTQVPSLLSWTPAPVCRGNLCGGYYQDPLVQFDVGPLPPLGTTPVQIDADQTHFQQSGISILTGKVTIMQPGRQAHADQVNLERDPVTGKLSTGTLIGNVTLREPGKLLVGETAHMDLHSKITDFFHALYRLVVSAPSPRGAAVAPPGELNAWGKADRIQQDAAGIIVLDQATYSTCAPTTVCAWQVSAESITLNRDTGRGHARHAWLKIKGAPVFYVPYFNFPIDDRRQTGFLFPTLGTSTQSGFNINTPFYWNIAPNYDATITPRIFSKRGILGDGLFNYLTPMSMGSIELGGIGNDHVFRAFQQQAKIDYPSGPLLNQLQSSSTNRGYFSWQNQTVFNPHWKSNLNFNYVSDSYFIQDFGSPAIVTPNQLPKLVNIQYSGDYWNFTGALQSYQTLHPINQSAVSNPYAQLPELDLNGNFPNQAYGLNYKISNQFIYFERMHNPGEATIGIPKGGRLNVQPGVSLPFNGLAGYVIPTLQLALTHYDIGNQVSGYQTIIQRNLPIFNIDSGLYFDRSVTLGKQDWQQTLEPRLFYLYVPYVNQNNIPLFDTALVPFNYDSLFLTNRFSGIDRIGDANQITFALSTRLLDEDSGEQKFRASIGQILYFQNRQVTTCSLGPAAASTNTVCVNPIAVIGATSPTERTSPLAGQLVYYLNQSWNATANLAWDPHIKQAVNGGANVQYMPKPNHILNLTYNFIRFGDAITTTPPTAPLSHKNDFNQLGFSFAWPIKEHWNAIGSWNYNVSHAYPQTFFYGIEYDTCCWAVRLVAGRAFAALGPNNEPTFNSNIYLQWRLKGLGTVGTQTPTNLLTAGIPGYQDNFQVVKG